MDFYENHENEKIELFNAIESDDLKKFIELQKNFNINVTDYEGQTTLIVACDWGSTNIANHVLNSGIDIHKTDLSGTTPLIAASAAGFPKTVKRLIDLNADVSKKDKTGWSALMAAACNGADEVCRLLIDEGADIDISDNQGRDVFNILEKDSKIFKIIMEAKESKRKEEYTEIKNFVNSRKIKKNKLRLS